MSVSIVLAPFNVNKLTSEQCKSSASFKVCVIVHVKIKVHLPPGMPLMRRFRLAALHVPTSAGSLEYCLVGREWW